MIFSITFIFALLLHIARAVPGCSNAAPPNDLYDTTYDDVQQAISSHIPPPQPYKVTWNAKYDNSSGDTSTLTCSNLAPIDPHFGNIPNFPLIGASFGVTPGTGTYCGQCLGLFNLATNISIAVYFVDHVPVNFTISKEAFDRLGGTGNSLEAVSYPIGPSNCGMQT